MQMSMVYFGFDPPQEKLGRFCQECLREHFNEDELCTRCRERKEKEEEGE
jgi:hypothetical protein